MRRKKLVQITAVFFAFMLCFTILSRAADQLSVAVVKTQRPQNQTIEHAVRTSGKIVQNQELAVTTLPDQRVTAISVREGQRVKKGDLLFEIDLTLLEEKILNQRQEMEKQELQVKDAKSQKAVSAQQKANSQAQAAEQYSLSTRQAGVQLARAKQQLKQAKEKLKKFRKSAGVREEDSQVEDALMQALEDRTDAYVAAQGELRTLEWEIENAVYTAKQNAAAGTSQATLIAEDRNLSGSAQATLIAEDRNLSGSAQATLVAEDRNLTGSAEPEIVSDTDSISLAAEMEGPEIIPGDTFSGLGGDGSVPEIEVEIEVDEMTPDMGIGGWGDPGTNDGSADVMDSGTGTGNMAGSGPNDGSNGMAGSEPNDGSNGMAGSGPNDGSNNMVDSDLYAGESPDVGDVIPDDFAVQGGTPVTPEELAQIEQTVRDGYSRKLAEVQKKVRDAQSEKETAEAALMQYQQEQLAAGRAETAKTAQQLAADVKAAQQAYEDASLAANAAAVTSGRAVATANIADPSNSSDRMSEITYEQMELTLEKLEGLKKDKGRIYAEADGLITKINIMTGEKTPDTTAILMTDLSKGYRFTADITKEQQKYIGAGDLVRLTSGDGKQKLEELPVESVTVDENNEDLYHVTVQIPEDTFEIGMNVNLDFSRKSAVYPVTVPLAALHLDSRNQAYVLTVEEYESIMGAENRARRINVTVQEQNESYAALAEGVIGTGQEVIVESDKAVDDGSRVRVG